MNSTTEMDSSVAGDSNGNAAAGDSVVFAAGFNINNAATGNSNAAETGDSNAAATYDGNTEATGDSNTGATGDSNTGATGDSNTEVTGDGNTEATGDSDTVSVGCDAASSSCNVAQFWGCVSIYMEKPHILNRRLCGITDVWWGVCRYRDKLLDQQMTNYWADRRQQDALKKQLEKKSEGWSGHCDVELPPVSGDSDQQSLMDDDINAAGDELFKVSKLKQSIFEVLQSENNSPKHSDANGGSSLESDWLDMKEESCADQDEMITKMKKLLENDEYGFTEILVGKGDSFQPHWQQLNETKDVLVVIRKAFPKNTQRFATAIEVIFLDGDQSTACFLSSSRVITKSPAGAARSPSTGITTSSYTLLLLPSLLYQLSHRQEAVWLHTAVRGQELMQRGGTPDAGSAGEGSSNGLQWLQKTVLPRVTKWAAQISESGDTGSQGSLVCVDVQAYSQLYHQLKSKYAAKLVQSWTERTDPLKFVHEDIGIATYLLLVWRRRDRPQRFLDLGCGNGLLVYILTGEGHSGTGLDIKSRTIWKTYPDNIDLREKVVRPCDDCLDPSVDWLIGNHSDELTPWIPVMAAKNSYTCSFFLLPCCPHDFTAKYLRQNSTVSQYADYLDYIQKVGLTCGFYMDRDRLKIASTRRVCFIGERRAYPERKLPQILGLIQEFIDKRAELYVNHRPTRNDVPAHDTSTTGTALAADVSSTGGGVTSNSGSSALWSGGFVARAKEQRVRNCTQLQQEVKDDLIRAVVAIVLQDQDAAQGSLWCGGARTELSAVAGQLGRRRLQKLKQECGGLQTLFRNHRDIFVMENGTVRLRTPCTLSEEWKRHRTCWFVSNHPQGCPNSPDTCIYNHPADLQTIVATASA